MDLAKAKEVERLKRQTAVAERINESNERRRQIDSTRYVNAVLKGNALVESALTQIAVSLGDALQIRGELLPQSPELRTEHQRRQLEEELHRTISAQFNQIKQSFANLRIRVSPNVWSGFGTREMALKQRASTAIRLLYLEGSEEAKKPELDLK